MNKREKTIEALLEFYVKEFSLIFSAEVIKELSELDNNLERILTIHACLRDITATIDRSVETIARLDQYPDNIIDEMLEEFKKTTRLKFN